VTASSADAPAAAGKLDQGIVRRKHRVAMTQERGICREIARVPDRAGLTHTTIGWRHSARQFDQRQMERQEEAGDGRLHTADPPQTDAYGMGGAAYISFDVIFNRAVLEIVSHTESGNVAWLQRIVSRGDFVANPRVAWHTTTSGRRRFSLPDMPRSLVWRDQMQRFFPRQSTHAIESGTLDTIHPPVAARS
jgi:hypothetical protein